MEVVKVEPELDKEELHRSLLSKRTLDKRKNQWETFFGQLIGQSGQEVEYILNPDLGGSSFIKTEDDVDVDVDVDIEEINGSVMSEDMIYETDYIAQARDTDNVKFNRVMDWYFNVFKPGFANKRSVIEIYDNDIEMNVYLLFYLSENNDKHHQLPDIVKRLQWRFEQVMNKGDYIKKEDLREYIKYMGFQYDVAKGIIGLY